jgi:hypothetical protein
MKYLLDSSFRYRSSFNTDVRKTFEKVRREQKAAKERDQAKSGTDVQLKLLQLEPAKKASAG